MDPDFFSPKSILRIYLLPPEVSAKVDQDQVARICWRKKKTAAPKLFLRTWKRRAPLLVPKDNERSQMPQLYDFKRQGKLVAGRIHSEDLVADVTWMFTTFKGPYKISPAYCTTSPKDLLSHWCLLHHSLETLYLRGTPRLKNKQWEGPIDTIYSTTSSIWPLMLSLAMSCWSIVDWHQWEPNRCSLEDLLREVIPMDTTSLTWTANQRWSLVLMSPKSTGRCFVVRAESIRQDMKKKLSNGFVFNKLIPGKN